jgi:hypothetical protein
MSETEQAREGESTGRLLAGTAAMSVVGSGAAVLTLPLWCNRVERPS